MSGLEDDHAGRSSSPFQVGRTWIPDLQFAVIVRASVTGFRKYRQNYSLVFQDATRDRIRRLPAADAKQGTVGDQRQSSLVRLRNERRGVYAVHSVVSSLSTGT